MEEEKIFLGIQLGFNSSASIVSNKRFSLANIQSERITNIKNCKEIPLDAIVTAIKITGITKIDHFSYCHYEDLTYRYIKEKINPKYNYILEEFEKDKDMDAMLNINAFLTRLVNRVIKDNGIEGISIFNAAKQIEHYEAHENSIYPFYGYPDVWNSMVADGFGGEWSGVLSTHYRSSKGKKQTTEISRVPLKDSPALVYQFVTGAFGFKEHMHEGKITGLAAYGKPRFYENLLMRLTGKKRLAKASANSNGFVVDEDLLEPLSEEQVRLVESKGNTGWDFKTFLRLKNTVYKFAGEILGKDYDKAKLLEYVEQKDHPAIDLAATVQHFAEQVILNWVKLFNNKYHLFLAGGLFANVKLNQRLNESGRHYFICVAPPMGDEGTSLGAAWKCMMEDSNYDIDVVPSEGTFSSVAFTGTDASDDGEVDAIMKEAESLDNIEIQIFDTFNEESEFIRLINTVAKFLAEKKIVHYRYGRGEYGPRALGHATTYYTAEDPNGTKYLNKAMNRSEFMPYAPCVLEENCDGLFEHFGPVAETSRYMTMTVAVKDWAKDVYKGAVHVDGTARPQSVPNDYNVIVMRAILIAYENMTGQKMLINTSYNIHNNPTCNYSRQCWEAWKSSGFVGKALVLNNVMFINKNG